MQLGPTKEKFHESTKFSVGIRDVTDLVGADNLLLLEAGLFSPESPACLWAK